MSSTIGKNLKVSVFGQSHSPAIGVTVDGLLPGEKIDFDRLYAFMQRRAPGKDRFSTTRKEADLPKFLSGVVGDVTCGVPLTAIIENTNTRSGDYANICDIPRPGHADYTAQIRYGGFQDVAGGGHFSGRLTAPLCIAGGICLQALERKNIHIAAHIANIGGIKDDFMDPMAEDALSYDVSKKAFPVINDEQGRKMQQMIDDARMDCDSIGGIIECMITGVPAGVGDPMFDGLENKLSAALFGIPAVKGLEFGDGFMVASMRGSDNNDPYVIAEDGTVKTTSNHHGGILGGISSGMPIIFRLAFKPTPSIAKPQKSISLSKMENTTLKIEGRHDPCIVQRAVPVVEAVAAITIYDALLKNY